MSNICKKLGPGPDSKSILILEKSNFRKGYHTFEDQRTPNKEGTWDAKLWLDFLLLIANQQISLKVMILSAEFSGILRQDTYVWYFLIQFLWSHWGRGADRTVRSNDRSSNILSRYPQFHSSNCLTNNCRKLKCSQKRKEALYVFYLHLQIRSQLLCSSST